MCVYMYVCMWVYVCVCVFFFGGERGGEWCQGSKSGKEITLEDVVSI